MSHLSLSDRSEIENGLRHGDSFNDIARRLHVAKSTVMREILRHMTTSEKARDQPVHPRRSRCNRRFACASCSRPLQNRKCSNCGVCNSVCPDFEEIVCERLARPPYVCNGCTGEGLCVLRKKFYIAAPSQEEYRRLLASARKGAAVTDAEREEMSDMLASGFKKGQPQKKQVFEPFCNPSPIDIRGENGWESTD